MKNSLKVYARYCTTCEHIYGATVLEYAKWGSNICPWCKAAGGNHHKLEN